MRRDFVLCLVLLITVTGSTAGQPSPDDFHWLPGFHSPGLNGTPETVVEFEGDLVVAGSFNQAGPTQVRSVARWDGTSWRKVGDNLGSPTCFAAYDGTLIAAGEYVLFDGLNQDYVARWDGTTWTPVPSPMVTYAKPARPKACAVYDGKLIIGGDFDLSGDFGSNIVAWGGSAWSRLSTGINGPVQALTVLGSELIAGGSFTQAGGTFTTNVARWDGTTWRTLGAGLPGTVTRLAAWNGELWAMSSGAFPYRWNGTTWEQVPFGVQSRMDALSRFFVLSDGLYAVGTLNLSGATTAVLERWEAPSWVPVGPDVPGGLALAARYGGDLLALGEHRPETAGNEFARLNGDAWETIEPAGGAIQGESAVVSAMCRFRGDLVVGGLFTTAGDVAASNIARWDGSAWHPLGSGTTGQILALATYQDDLIAGGVFGTAGGTPASGLARWDGSSWQQFGGGANGSVHALAAHGDTLYVGGFFTALGGFPAAHVAFWNGAWHALGSGTDDLVHSLLLLPNGDLIAGGRFTQAGTAAAAFVARWTRSEWLRIGDGITGYVSADVFGLTSWNGGLVVGGTFTPSGSPLAGSRVLGYDGTTWSLLGKTTGGQIPGIMALATFGGDLVVGGHFGSIDNVPLGGVGRFDGASWRSFGGGAEGAVNSLLSETPRLFVGGGFTRAGDKPSYHVAVWDESVVPVRLLSFTAGWKGCQAVVSWQSAAEGSGVDFHVYREARGAPRAWIADALWAADGLYSIPDPGAPQTGASYWLMESGRDGSVVWHGPAVLRPRDAAVRRLFLAQNQPNPVQGSTTIAFETPSAGPVEITVYDVTGRRVAILLNEELPAGPHSLAWDGKGGHGQGLSPGFYFYTLRVGGKKKTKKLLILS